MLKFAVIADIHLSYLTDTVQHKAFEFACEKIKNADVDAVVCLGDATAYGDVSAAEYFVEKMEALSLPQLRILGNSDVRNKETIKDIGRLVTEKELYISGYRLVGIDTSEETIKEEDRELLASSDEKTIVFMHHPYWCLKQQDAEMMQKFLDKGLFKALFCGHLHISETRGNVYLVQALDPDKAIGEPACVTYITVDDDGTITTEFDHFEAEMPEELDRYLGLSCFDPWTDIPYAIKHNLKNIELRPSAVELDRERLLTLVTEWRACGGCYLSLHMPDIGYKEGLIGVHEWEKAIDCAKTLCVDGITVHVPKASVRDMKGKAKQEIVHFVSQKVSELSPACKIGIENMHMTADDRVDEERRYGYTPSECKEVMELINEQLGKERVGLLLDVGHARNNAPFSGPYPVGTWYGEVGKYTIAYHVHQVEMHGDKMENHVPIKGMYGPLISYNGFAYAWNHGILNRAPMFLEIRGGQKNYCISVELFSGSDRKTGV